MPLTPLKDAVLKMQKQKMTPPNAPIPLRRVRYDINASRFVLAKTLLNQTYYSLNDLAELYQGRWDIEEFYNILWQITALEHFPGKSECGAHQ